MNPWRKLRLALLAALFLLALRPASVTLRMWRDYRGEKLLRVDYSLYVASAAQGLHQGWHRLYDLEAQQRELAELPPLWFFPNVYTPALSVVMIPFTRLSLDAGYAIWQVVLLLCLLLSWWILAPGDWPARLAQLPMLFVPYVVQQGLWMGQIIAVEMAVVALAWAALRRGHDRTAGALLCAMALKPQGLMLLPFTLLAAGRRKVFFAWAAGMALAGAALLALVGLDGAAAYARRLSYAQSHLYEFWVAWSYSLARRFAGHPAALRLVEALAAALALVAAFRNRGRPEVALCAGLAGALLTSPFVHLDDFMLLFPAGWLLIRAFPGPAAVAAALAGYGAMLLSANEHVGGRWLLLYVCLLVPALAAIPAGRARRAPAL